MSNICMLGSDSGSSDSPHVGQRLLFFRMGPPFKNRDSWGSIQDIGGPGGQKKLVDQLTAKATTLTSSLFEVSATGSMSQVNF